LKEKFLPPLHLHDAVYQLHNLIHASLHDEAIDPSDSLISEQKTELVNLAYLNHLWLLDFSQIMDKVRWIRSSVNRRGIGERGR
jgi:hypothetical protein